MNLVRRFNQKGIAIFRAFLKELKMGKEEPPPVSILEDKNFSSPFDAVTEIKNMPFPTRLDAARFFSESFKGLNSQQISIDVGLWSWLSLFYFDQVCPADMFGRRKPGRDYRHILLPGYPYGHRHLLGGAYLVYEVYKLKDDLGKLLLSTSPFSVSPFHQELGSRMNLITNRNVIDSANRLYYDASSNRQKRGSLSRKIPGNLYRFIDVLQQLEINYDLFSMPGEKILKLLPHEFQHWLT